MRALLLCGPMRARGRAVFLGEQHSSTSDRQERIRWDEQLIGSDPTGTVAATPSNAGVIPRTLESISAFVEMEDQSG